MIYELNVVPLSSLMAPIISFIVTYHNEPSVLLQECLESILALRLEKDEGEIIVVDDGSEHFGLQDSGIKFTPIADRESGTSEGRTVFYVRQAQAGLSVARNTGLSFSQGKYIQFVDADDCLIPSDYETVLRQVRKGKADVVMFGMRASAQLPKDLEERKPQPTSEDSEESRLKGRLGESQLLHHNLRAAAWGYAFKRDVLGDLRFCPGLLHEDELFTPQLFLRAKSLVDLNVKAYFYRQHDGTITHSKKPAQVKKRLDDILFIIKELRSLGDNRLERRIRQLTVDYLQKTWTQTHSLRELHSRVSELRKEGFLPLPLRCYSLRYLVASLIF